MTVRTTRTLSPIIVVLSAVALASCGSSDSSSSKSAGATASKSAAASGQQGSVKISDEMKVLETAFINEKKSSWGQGAALLARIDTTGLPKKASLLVQFTAKLKNGQTKTETTTMPVYRPGEPVWALREAEVSADVDSVSATAQYSGEASGTPEAELRFSDFAVQANPVQTRVTFAVTNPGTKTLPLASGPVVCFDAKNKPVAAGTGMAQQVAPKATSKAGYAIMTGNPKGATCKGYTMLGG